MKLPQLVSAIERASLESVPVAVDSMIVDKAEWFQTITPSLPYPRYNVILRTIVDKTRIGHTIREVSRQYKELNLPFQWEVGPSSQPMELGVQLQKNGLNLVEEVYGMAVEPERVRIEIKPKITIEQISEPQVTQWVSTSLSGWEYPENITRSLEQDLLVGIRNKSKSLRYFLAKYDGTPAGVAMLRFTHGVGHLQGSAVIPKMRRLGLYQALVGHRLKVLSEMKIPFATVECLKNTSAPICKKLGFETICRFQIFQPN